jgi:hypothetical protein
VSSRYSNVTNIEIVSPHFNIESADTDLLSRKTVLRFPLREPVSRKTLADFPLTRAVSRKTSLDFPLTELVSTDITSMFADIEAMSVVTIWITHVLTEFSMAIV